MKKIALKISCILGICLSLFVILSTNSQASNAKFEIIDVQNEESKDYIFYIEGYEDQEFEFAFSNNSSEKKDKLHFYKNWKDNNNANVACLDDEMSVNLNEDIYLWIIDKNGDDIVVAEKVNLDTKEFNDIENLTKLIKVDASQSKTITNKVGDTTLYTTVGKLVVTDNPEFSYKYSLIKMPNKTISTFLQKINDYENTYTTMTMFSKIQTLKDIDENFTSLIENADWKDLKNMTIEQPEDAQDGDQYIVLLQQLSNGIVVKNDLKILDCYKKMDQTKSYSTTPIAVTSALPVTADSIVLYVAFAVILVIIVAIVIRIFFIKNKNENQK